MASYAEHNGPAFRYAVAHNQELFDRLNAYENATDHRDKMRYWQQAQGIFGRLMVEYAIPFATPPFSTADILTMRNA